MESTALVTAPASPLPAVAADYVPVAGFDQLSPDDFSLPTLKLVQAQTKNDGAPEHMGWYIKADTNDYLKSPNVLVVGIAQTRILFPATYAADNKALCRSDDAYAPRTEFMDTQVGNVIIPDNCAACPFALWDGSKPPACTLADNWAVILPNGDPAILRLSGSSAAASKNLKNIMRAKQFRKQPTHITLGSKFMRTDQGQYYVAVITPATDPLTPEALNTARMFAGVNLAARAAVEEQEAPVRAVAAQDQDDDHYEPSDNDAPSRPF